MKALVSWIADHSIAERGRALLFLATLLAIFLLLGAFWPLGPDYSLTFRPVAAAFVQGQTRLYDANSLNYFNAPWAILLIAPTLLFSPGYGQALITIGTMVGLVLAVHAINAAEKNNRWYSLALALAAANLHTFDLLLRGNLDGFLLLGLGLGCLGVARRRPLWLGAGLWLFSIKPVNIVLPALVLLWATWHWSRREKFTYMAPLGLTFLLSLPLFGFDWPARYVQFTRLYPPFIYLQTSLWRAFNFFDLNPQDAVWVALPLLAALVVVVRRAGLAYKQELLALAIALNLTISPYTLGSHYVLLAPVLVRLALWRKVALGLWLLTFTPLLRLRWGFEAAWVDIIYPLVLMMGMFWLLAEESRRSLAGDVDFTMLKQDTGL